MHNLYSLDFFIHSKICLCHKSSNFVFPSPELFKKIYCLFIPRQLAEVLENAYREMVVYNSRHLNFRLTPKLPSLKK